MSTTDLVAEVRDTLIASAGDLGITGSYVWGEVPTDATYPYVTLYPTPSIETVIDTDGSTSARDGIQIDVFARTLTSALSVGDGIRDLVTGVSAAVAGRPISGLQAEGPWRVLREPSSGTRGGLYHRHTLTFYQREIRDAA